MNLIKYEMKGSYCKTKCPNGIEYNVGSIGCQYKCEHHVSINTLTKEVDCSFRGRSKVIKTGPGIIVKGSNK